MRPDSYPVEICLPPISDEALVEIHNFLNDFLRLFESHYGAQIHRFYEDRSFDNLVHPNPHTRPPHDDPPF
jgi:hypothetical protein